MGVDGVAWATFLCQGVSCVLALFFLFRRFSKIKTQGKAAVFSWRLLRQITAVAVPSILQQSFVSVGNIIIQGVINNFGTQVIAGYSASVKLNNMVISSLSTLSNGISNYTAQNLGAKKFNRILAGCKAGLKIVWTICLPLVLLYFFAGRYLVYIFLDNPTGQAMEIGTLFLQIISPFYFVVAAKLVIDGIFRGAGMMKQFVTSTFTDLLLRVFLAIFLSSTALETTGIWISWPIGWTLSTALSALFYLYGIKKKKAKSLQSYI